MIDLAWLALWLGLSFANNNEGALRKIPNINIALMRCQTVEPCMIFLSLIKMLIALISL